MGDAFEVALIGRPNVGKSTLFNRLVGKRVALVDDTPGVTRDRRKGAGRIGDLEFTVVDTAGLEDADPGSLAGRMRAQTEEAVRAADLTLFMIDARVGVTPADEIFAGILRRTGRPVVLVANKAEGRGGIAGALEGFELGLGEPVPLSAEHGEGLGDLRQAIEAHMSREAAPDLDETGDVDSADPDGAPDPNRPLQVAIIGRPNAGKSTLINTIVGEDRLLTGPEAGITRDSISIDWEHGGRKFRLVDTAGMRRKSKIQEKLEKLSVGDSLRSIQFAEVVVLTIDATQPFDKQDLQLADLVEREGRAIIVALDKWDLVTDQQNRLRELREDADHALPQLGGLAVVAVSGLTGQGIDKLMAAIVKAYDTWNIRVSTAALNKWLERMLEDHPPPATSGRRLKLRYMTQSKARPPTFIAFCSRPEALPESYRRYLVNGLRERFGLQGIPIRLVLRKRDNPFADKD